MAKSTTFKATESAKSGQFVGFYLWSDPNNWTNGVPSNGDSVNVGTYSNIVVDDLSGLTSLASLSQTATEFQTIYVTGNLTIGSVNNASGTRTSFDVSGKLTDNSASNTGGWYDGNYYAIERGGEVIIAAAPAAEFEYYTSGGILALEHPNSSNSASIVGAAAGDVLELPGTRVLGFSDPSTGGLTVTTDSGTYAFANFHGQNLGYTSQFDASTGLVALTFTAGSTPPTDTTTPAQTADRPVSTTPGGLVPITTNYLSYNDPDNSDLQLTYTIVSAPQHGSVLRNGSVVTSFTQADLDSGYISYVENGALVSSDAFTFYVSDTAGNRTANATFSMDIKSGSNGSTSSVRLNDATMWQAGAFTEWSHVAYQGGTYHYYTQVTNYDGFDIENISTTSDANFSGWDAASASGAHWFFDGNQVLADPNTSSGPGTIALFRYDSSVFNATSVDLDTQYAESGVSVTFTGYRVDGSTVTQTFGLNNTQGMQTFNFNSSFTDLTELDFTPTDTVLFDNFVVSSAVVASASYDFDADGTSDVLWRNSSNGDIGYWALTNNVATWHDFGLTTTAYSVVGVGDFNGDGTSDVLWRNNTSGDIGYWAISNNIATWYDFGVTNTAYSVVGVGDFNGDGTSDVLWHNNSTGDIGYWGISNNVATWNDFGLTNTAYSVVGVGDFNGDGISDVLWRNSSNGDIGYWGISNNVATWHDFGLTNTAYSVVGVGDFNGDGTSDILWRNNSSGDIGYWGISNNVATWHDFGLTNTSYSVAAVGDYNGDGVSDVMWHNQSNGDTGYWGINNNAATWHDFGLTSASYNVIGFTSA